MQTDEERFLEILYVMKISCIGMDFKDPMIKERVKIFKWNINNIIKFMESCEKNKNQQTISHT